MPTPFPGMDPYLEQPAIWPDLHNSLIVVLRDDLAPRLRPRYYVSIEERTYTVEPGDLLLAGRADVAVVGSIRSASAPAPELAESGGVMVVVDMPDQIRETYLEVRSATGEVITLVVILSPTNKRTGEGRGLYLRSAIRYSPRSPTWSRLTCCGLASRCRCRAGPARAITGSWSAGATAARVRYCCPSVSARPSPVLRCRSSPTTLSQM